MLSAVFILLMLFAISIPVALSLGIAPLPALMDKGIPLVAVPQTMFEAMDSFALMAVPFFVLAGRLMQTGGIARRLIDLGLALIGWVKGGLGGAAVLTTMFFSTICGSSSATTAAIGSVMIPEMERKGYPRPFAASVIASSGELGVILPPSVPMIIYAMLTGTSVASLFVGGILPGLLIASSLIITILILSRIHGYGEAASVTPGEWLRGVWRALCQASLSLLMPVIILGGIYGGFFTATEAAVVAVAYAFLLGVFVYREISLKELPAILWSSAVTSAIVLLIVGFASVFAYVLSLYQAPQQVARMLLGVSDNPLVFLLLVNIALLVIGLFMETFAAILILAPVLAPVAISLGIDPVHFGVIVIVNLAIGMVTPPVGVNLFLVCGIANVTMERLMRPLSIFLAVLLCDLMIITYVPVLWPALF
ncbi:TRAP transporter large permease [Kerstersia gyiorum]|uniref:TRAP transporter large permease protein n=1 Tax=Kerstersia gyiorum TaxID=206506 RepID=A0A171KT62_9BURK|nr:TRAP transporter large permease [Kerstersia gyiorum]KAB0543062.1 TRAP transporter large permease [Kerstersia gyiorum]KKO72079.1 C4-dicarboxylate ABC transporter permease [Kerstersia gyiorum]MCP1634699.1 tripartite ATP-independent transporter DctM subunit [Kerstersia gyiorum]MCP1635928.1 tripartite ATP-independent transporter DctM subunit [Kerstersia gyiorum]MCP1672599.1 tripartite ATP-independent transporter DctM subunit [Kerstersia gyiorum]